MLVSERIDVNKTSMLKITCPSNPGASPLTSGLGIGLVSSNTVTFGMGIGRPLRGYGYFTSGFSRRICFFFFLGGGGGVFLLG